MNLSAFFPIPHLPLDCRCSAPGFSTLLLLLAGAVHTATAQSVYSTPYYITTLAGSGVAGSADGTGTAASFGGRTSPAVDAAGNLYLADWINHTIRKITPAGVVTTIAGLAGVSGSADGTGSAARFRGPRGVAVDSAGTVFVVEQFNHTIRKISPAGVVTTIAGQAGAAGSVDGAGSAARFDAPRGIAVDASGNLYVADGANHTIRKLTPAGLVSTLAGQPGTPGDTDGFGSVARFNGANSIAVDTAGNVYVGDFGNSTIRKISPAGQVTTLAGLASNKGSTDGTGTAARFYLPTAVAVDGAANVYVTDVLNQTVRRVTAAGVVTTLAGLNQTSGYIDGLGSQARFNQPYGIAVDSRGNLYISDEENYRIRRSVFPPTLTLQPVPQSVNVGATVVFTANATSDYPTTLQWRKDGTPIPGATNPTLTLTNVQVAAAGTYTLTATNIAGSTTSNPAVLTLNVTVSGESVTQTVTVGSPVQFRYTAAVQAGTTFQWRKDGQPIAGATNANFTLSSAVLADAGSYTVVVNTGAVSTTSNTAILIVLPAPAPAFTTHPISQTVAAGSPVQFSVSVTSSTPVAYQWRRNGIAIMGATNALLTLAGATTDDAGSYTVAATNAGGVSVSNAATLTVTVPAAPPVITAQPQEQTLTTGAPLILSVGVSGAQPLAYQWFKNGTLIPGATNLLFAVANAQPADAGSYNVAVTNTAGSAASGAAIVRVSSAPTIVTHPASRAATAGEITELFVSAEGTPPLAYQWLKNGTPIAGATRSILGFTPVQLTDAGSYSVGVSNASGSVTSTSAEISVTPPAPSSRLSNVSIRTSMAAGQVVIVGLAVEGGGRDVLIRAAGPALAPFGVPNPMTDPRVELFRGSTQILANEDWDASLAPAFVSTGAFGWTVGSRDAAFRQNLEGAVSIHARGTGAGVVLVEAYDLGAGNAPRLVNVSARNRVGAGDDVLIAGFNITGTGTKRLLIRGVGPGLAAFQVSGVLSDPRLELYNSAGVRMAENDDWTAAVAANFALVGAFALEANSRDAALVTSLSPGSYSVLVRGAEGSTGEALVEVYELP